MIVDCALYRDGQRTDQAADWRALRAQVAQPGDFVWLGLHDPDPAEMREVAETFQLHPLAVEDALKPHQRPKVERFGDIVFMILKTLWYVDEHDAVETGEIAIFLGKGFVVSVRNGEGDELHSVRQQLEATHTALGHGPAGVLYAVLDRIVDAYLDVVDELSVDVEEVETSVFSPARTNDAPRIYVLRRELAEVRRAVLPLRDPVGRLMSGALIEMPAAALPFFRNVSDHLARAAELVDTLDAMLSTAFDAYVAQISVRQNDDMRKISAWVGLLAPPTLIAGIYGMNFHHMALLDWRYAYPLTLLLMVAISGTLWVLFKRSGWL